MRVFVIMRVCVSGAVSDTGDEHGMRAASSVDCEPPRSADVRTNA